MIQHFPALAFQLFSSMAEVLDFASLGSWVQVSPSTFILFRPFPKVATGTVDLDENCENKSELPLMRVEA